MWMGIHVQIGVMMIKTIQITLPQELLARIDQTVAELDTNRSALARDAFEEFLFRLRIKEMERQDAAGYALLPQDPDEVAEWEVVQDWGDGVAS